MMMCMTVDDEPLALKQLNKYISQVPFLELAGSFDNGLKASAFIADNPVDLVFIDIDMPDMNGLEFVRALINHPMIVFTTAYSEYAIESYKLDAVDYLLKPISFTDFMRSVNKAQRLFELQQRQPAQTQPEQTPANEPHDNQAVTADDPKYITVKSGYKVVLIKIEEISYIESENEYLRLHLVSGEVVTTLLRLKNIESVLPPETFMRIHRSYIVNLNRITAFAKGRVFVDQNTSIPVGENYKDVFNEYIEKAYLNL